MQRHDHPFELWGWLVGQELLLDQLKYLLGYYQVGLSELSMAPFRDKYE